MQYNILHVMYWTDADVIMVKRLQCLLKQLTFKKALSLRVTIEVIPYMCIYLFAQLLWYGGRRWEARLKMLRLLLVSRLVA